jgi:predicted kinase
MQAMNPERSEPNRLESLKLARAHWLFALAELEEPDCRPGLVLVTGLPGTGKSTLAADLTERAGFTVIRSDQVRKELAGVTGNSSSSPGAFGVGLYTPNWNQRVYSECLRRAEDGLFEGKRVLIDATFREQAHSRLFLAAARRWAIPFCLIHCQADPAIARARLAARRGDASDADVAIHAELARRWEPPDPPTRELARTIDTSGTRSQSLVQALALLHEFRLRDAAR